MTTCKLCDKKDIGYGNNGQPLCNGKVCDNCNGRVIMFRFMEYQREKAEKKIETENSQKTKEKQDGV